jgi:hypothetical protein
VCNGDEVSEPWPLSAMATKILLEGRIRPLELLPLAYKELVILGAVEIRLEPRRRFLPRRTWMSLVEGAEPPSPELADLLRTLHHHAAMGGRVDKVIERVRAKDPGLPRRIAATAGNGLARAGLAVADDRRALGVTYRRRIAATPAGQALRAEFARLVKAPASEEARKLPPALLLLVHPWQRAEIDRALRNGGADGSPAFSMDFSQFDAMTCFDAAADSGGDGGGGDCS